eukprot:m.1225772 g.1225772  ORF g.1225772 m.1225772 type:complete len:1068 (-) comp24635_c0_seq1:2136-5339(-)
MDFKRWITIVACISLDATFATSRNEGNDGSNPADAAPPILLRADGLLSPSIGVSIQPRLSFVPAGWNSTNAAPRNQKIASYRIVVMHDESSQLASNTGSLWSVHWSPLVIWDSGNITNTSIPADGTAATVGVPLLPQTTYIWTATWTNDAGTTSPVAIGTFDTGIVAESDWHQAVWLGAGHNEFKTVVDLAAHTNAGQNSASRIHIHRARAYVASPGGFLLWVNGTSIGTDTVGVAGWFDWTKQVYHRVLDLDVSLSGTYSVGDRVEIRFAAGCGAWCPCDVPTWVHSHRTIRTPQGAQPVLRALIVLDTTVETVVPRTLARFEAQMSVVESQVVVPTLPTTFQSRAGTVSADSSWLGATMDWTLSSNDGWVAPARAVPEETLTSGDIPNVSLPLSIPPIKITPHILAASVLHTANPVAKDGSRMFVYKFPRMVVGVATVMPGSWTGAGNISLEYCEVLASGSEDTCLRMKGFEANGTVDRHVVDASIDGQAKRTLTTRFSWRGFQYVIVRTSPGVVFRGAVGDLTAAWTAAELETPVSFNVSDSSARGGDTSVYAQVADMVARTQRSNMATGLPTDCPTREKHGWLGDARDTAMEAMYNLWTPPVYRLFLRQIIDAQAPPSSHTRGGFVPVVVPCHGGVDAAENDLSWTAGFPLIARWLVEYYGDTETVRPLWNNLRLWADGQLANATVNDKHADGLPDFSSYGDLCAPSRTSANAANVAQVAAASSFLQALDGLCHVARVLGETEDATRWEAKLDTLRHTFDTRFWNESTSTYGQDAGTVQTVNTLALVAGVPAGKQAGDRRARAVAALLDNAVQEKMLTTGNVGSTYLLSTLSSLGSDGHDAALAMVSRQEYPGWGYWLAQGATTCWEGWSTLDATKDHYKGSHNHGWLCGGVGAWLYGVLGGITPAADGYAVVRVAPRISKTLGPAHVSMRLLTVRGYVTSSWTRSLHTGHTRTPRVAYVIDIPIGSRGHAVLPVLANTSACVVDAGVRDTTPRDRLLWASPSAVGEAWVRAPRVREDEDGIDSISVARDSTSTHEDYVMELHLGSGRYNLNVYHGSACDDRM